MPNTRITRRKDKKGRVLKEGEYERPNGTYEFRWTTKAGTRKSIYAKTLPDLREKEKIHFTNVLTGSDRLESNITVNELYAKWIASKRGIKETTRSVYILSYNRYLRNSIGGIRVRELKKMDVKALYTQIYEEKKLKSHTLNTIHGLLHQILEAGVEDEYILVNPASKAIRELRREIGDDKTTKAVLTQWQQQQFENFLKETPRYQIWAPIVTTMLWTGMRVGEATALTWDDIDVETGYIHINRTMAAYRCKGANNPTKEMHLQTPKTKSSQRKIKMLPPVRQALEDLKKMQKEMELQCIEAIDGISNFVFLSPQGRIIRNENINYYIGCARLACNDALKKRFPDLEEDQLLPRLTSHAFRHTYATRMNEMGINAKVTQAMLGHTSVSMTLDTYTRATESLVEKELQHFSEAVIKTADVTTLLTPDMKKYNEL